MTGAELRAGLHQGQRVYGTCVVSPSPLWPAMLAETGLDFVFIDTEHMPLDRHTLSWMCQSFVGLGLPPIVRIPHCEAAQANSVIDGGAQGIVAPYCESVQEVQALVGAAKYRPLKGDRLCRVLSGDELLQEPTSGYIAEKNRDHLCLVNIESVLAIERLTAIVAVPGLDAVLIGPHDLSISMDLPEDYTHSKFTEAIAFIIDTARDADIGVGFHASFGLEQTRRWAERGANLIIHSSDYFLVRQTLKADLRQLRTQLGDRCEPERP